MAALTTTLIHQVLKTWAADFLIDVPAVHSDGEHFIEFDTLVQHVENLGHDELAEIMIEVEDQYFVK